MFPSGIVEEEDSQPSTSSEADVVVVACNQMHCLCCSSQVVGECTVVEHVAGVSALCVSCRLDGPHSCVSWNTVRELHIKPSTTSCVCIQAVIRYGIVDKV